MTYTQPTDAAIDAAHDDAPDTARDEALTAIRAEADELLAERGTQAQHPARRLLDALKADEHEVGNYVDEGNSESLETVCVDGYFNLDKLAAAVFPFQSGDHTVIGPECFTDADATVIAYKGQNYVLQPDPEPAKDRIEMDFTVTATSGLVIPIAVVATYPEGQGFYAAKGLETMPDHMENIWSDLVHRQDASTINVMLGSGHMRGDDGE